MNDVSRLLFLFDAYAAAVGQADATVSTRFLGRGTRINELRGGGDMGSRKIAAVMREFSKEWPEGVEWPAEIERPVNDGEAA